MDVIYLDFSKAFDKVAHRRLMHLLKRHGVAGKVLRWIGAWLNNRKQRVVLNGESSGWKEVCSGVPQGSVLGPTLFLVYINLINKCLSSKKGGFISQFADDTKLARVIEEANNAEELQKELSSLESWTQTWKMKFNETKCKVLHMGRKNSRHNYTINSHTLEKTESERDIGVIIAQNLKPADQCDRAAKKANQMLGQIKRSFTYRDPAVLMGLYKTFVRPKLEYCSPAWRPWMKKDINRLERVQKRAVKMINGLQGKTYEEKLKELNLLSLEERRERGDMITCFKIMRGLEDTDRDRFFDLVETEPSRVTRNTTNKLNMKHQPFQTEIRKYSFAVRVPKKWNSLPTHVRDAETLNQF